MNEPLKLDYNTSNVVSPKDNLLRALFTFWLNTGAMDERMRSDKIKPESKRTDHVGLAFMLPRMDEFKREFFAWAESDALASYTLNNRCMRTAAEFRFGTSSKWAQSPFDMIVGLRFKAITGMEIGKKLPQDLKKSFYVKASNRLIKFAKDLADPISRTTKQPILKNGRLADYDYDVRQWLEYILNPEFKDFYLFNKDLREIRDMYYKIKEQEPVGDVVQKLLDQAAILGVLDS